MVLLMGGMQGISPDLIEAADIDGASWLTKELRVRMPLLRRTIAMSLIISVVGSFLAFNQFYILTQGGPGTSTDTVVMWITRWPSCSCTWAGRRPCPSPWCCSWASSASSSSSLSGTGSPDQRSIQVMGTGYGSDIGHQAPGGQGKTPAAPRKAPARGQAQRPENKTARLTYAVTGTVLGALFIAPLVWAVLRSFQTESAITSAPNAASLAHLTVTNYQQLVAGPIHILHYVGNSLIVAAGTAVLTAVLATLAGYGFGRFSFRGRGVMFAVTLLALMIPYQAILTRPSWSSIFCT